MAARHIQVPASEPKNKRLPQRRSFEAGQARRAGPRVADACQATRFRLDLAVVRVKALKRESGESDEGGQNQIAGHAGDDSAREPFARRAARPSTATASVFGRSGSAWFESRFSTSRMSIQVAQVRR